MYDWRLATTLFQEHVKREPLRRHCAAVSSAMAWYAVRLGEDVAKWAAVGLLHDFDREEHPEEHPAWGVRLLESQGWPGDIIQAIGSQHDHNGIAARSTLERYLYACDEMTAFCAAVAWVRPSRKISEVDVRWVMKKLAIPAFATDIPREAIYGGAQAIGLPVEQHIGNVLTALTANAKILCLDGDLEREAVKWPDPTSWDRTGWV